MMENITTEELQAEVDRREKEAKKVAKPTQLSSMNFETVIKYCQEYVDSVFNEGRRPKDAKQYIFEAAMDTVFGKEIWDWLIANT